MSIFFHRLISFFDNFVDNLVCLFLVPVPARASAGAHARHVLAFVVSRFSASNYSDNNNYTRTTFEKLIICVPGKHINYSNASF